MIKRSPELIKVAYFLSKYGQLTPPRLLNTNSWKEAYHIFYEKLNQGRTVSTFEHTLKLARDSFDSHFPGTNRKGWKDAQREPMKLSGLSIEVFNDFENLTEIEVWHQIKEYADVNAKMYSKVFRDLTAIQDSENEQNTLKTEGGTKVYISRKVERTPSLRVDAFRIHGYDCMVCGFNFEKTYGSWGKDWAEVHHLIPISEKKDKKEVTNPTTDLAVLCSNCHSMVHRKQSIVLTIDELKSKLLSLKVNR